MNIIDLSHELHEEMPVFPGTEKPIFKRANTIEADGFAEHIMNMYSHTGTHIDAPSHMLKEGENLDDMDVSNFVGKAIIIDVKGLSKIDIDILKPYESKIKNAEFVILNTGHSKFWGHEEYFGGFPALTIDSAKWLCEMNLKGIGIDAISIDYMENTSFDVHHILMNKGLLIIENLTNLDEVGDDEFVLSVLPLKTKEADGSPIRAVAIKNV